MEKKSRWAKSNGNEESAEKLPAPDTAPVRQESMGVESEDTSVTGSQATRTSRWGRKEFPAAALKRELEALERAESRKGQTHIYFRVPSPEPRKAKRVRKRSRQPRTTSAAAATTVPATTGMASAGIPRPVPKATMFPAGLKDIVKPAYWTSSLSLLDKLACDFQNDEGIGFAGDALDEASVDNGVDGIGLRAETSSQELPHNSYECINVTMIMQFCSACRGLNVMHMFYEPLTC